MTTIQFLRYLQSLQIQIWLEAETIRYRGPAAALTSALKEELSKRKPELVEVLRQATPRDDVTPPPLSPARRDQPLPLSFAQQRLWFLDQLQPGVPSYVVSDAIEINHWVDTKALRRALNEIIRRHEILRTSFPSVDGVPLQSISSVAECDLRIIDLTDCDVTERQKVAGQIARAEQREAFDLASGPLLRFTLIQLEQARYLWLQSFHHIICDDWSKKLLDRELETLYEAFRLGQPSPLPEPAIQWADFAVWSQAWLQGPRQNALTAYWAKQLEGELPTLSLPSDGERRQPAYGRRGRFYLPAGLTSALRVFCEKQGVTLFMGLMAAYSVLLARCSGQSDFIIGAPISDRNRVETEPLIGFLLNTLPLRVRVEPNVSFVQLVKQVRETCLGAYAHPEVPYEALMPKLRVKRDGGANPLFQTLIGLLNTPAIEHAKVGFWSETRFAAEADGTEVRPDGSYASEEGNDTAKFDLGINFLENANGLLAKVEYDATLFEESSIARMVAQFQCLLRDGIERPEVPLADLAMMSEADQRALLSGASRGAEVVAAEECLHRPFERQVARVPHALAIEGEGSRLTYEELNERANQVAHWLRARGVGAESLVGLLFDRSPEMFVALVGILKAGAAYVPLDPAHPADRLRTVAEDADLKVLLTTEAGLKSLDLGARCVDVLCLDRDRALIEAQPTVNLPSIARPGNVASVLYTSGSTGRPKGVALTHSGISNFLVGATIDCGLRSSDRVLQFASIGFDASLEECFLALWNGGTLVLRPERMLDSAGHFVRECHNLQLTVLVLPTAYWHELLNEPELLKLPPSVRCVVIGGERALPEKLARWQQHVGIGVQLVNAYGPTEGSIAVTRSKYVQLRATGEREVSIGQPVANTVVYLLDQRMRPVAAGVPGELYLGGKAPARGYVNRPGLTAECFVPDPFSAIPGARLYRTGDVARFLRDGTIEYRGRRDTQVKIRGYRIEPREIEAVLRAAPGIRDVAVVVREDEPGQRRLVAYVAPQDPAATDVNELRRYLKGKLPSYMVPAPLTIVEALPTNANGKVAVSALPVPVYSTSIAAAERDHPRTRTEEMLLEIWKAVLRTDQIGPEDDFFDLGGHSLLATQVAARIHRSMQIDLPLRRLFEWTTVVSLAAHLDQLARTEGSAQAANALWNIPILPAAAIAVSRS